MTWLVLAGFLILTAAAYALGRRRAVVTGWTRGVRSHSQPGHYGLWTALWTLGPALLLLAVLGFAMPRLAVALAAASALTCLAVALIRIGPKLRARELAEGWIETGLMLCSCVAVAIAAGIILSLVLESVRFFSTVSSPWRFLTGFVWDPPGGLYGALPLFAGTALVTVTALVTAGPIGLFAAIYLAEYAGPRTRAVVKPVLEVLAGVPAVVYGLFAALTLGPILGFVLRAVGAKLEGGLFNGLGVALASAQSHMALTAGVVVGVMLIPFVTSLVDDILRAAPQSQRDGSSALGATRSETLKHVVLPWASRGIVGVMLLALSRAVGETMVVAMAAGLTAQATLNPLKPVATVTAEVVDLLRWEQDLASPTTAAAFGLGLTLLLATLGLNLLAFRIVRAYRNQYD
jgi:phosphate transport system permease protein